MSTFWTLNGKLVVDASGKPVLCEECPCEGAVPFECPPSGLANCYQLKDYTDGDFSLPSPCNTCFNSANPAWDGKFTLVIPCHWAPPTGRRISGKQLVGGQQEWGVSWFDHVPPTRWMLSIGCQGRYVIETIWGGGKFTGTSPVGLYTREIGCDTTSALEIEVCPP